MQTIGIERLRLSHFRSYGYLDLSLHSKHIVLSGQNGAGKTNLLEAISFLSPGRGLRKSKLTDVMQFGQASPWAVHAAIFDAEDVVSIATGQDPTNVSRRIVKVQGEAIQTHLQLGHFLSVNWVTPAMDRLFLEPSSVRRKFFDRLVYGIDPLHAERLSRYKQAMMERNRLLKERSSNKNWLDALEITMAQESIAIGSRRVEALQLLQEAHPFSDDAYFPAARLEFTGGIELGLNETSLVDQEEKLLQQLADNRSLDALIGGAQVGAHKMDFTAFHTLKNLNAAVCSTGEQKILLMWIMLAFVKLQTLRKPGVNILLLDEVAAHLDSERREVLFDKINSLNIQAWYSGTDHSLFSGLTNYSTQSYHLDHTGIRVLI
ncbi:MAG: DNA replication/repair protein RecF [Alphaproteobacteria bacterium]|nr:DNA replication/repair protein RecF [Alphaproteobacteria bacterium]